MKKILIASVMMMAFGSSAWAARGGGDSGIYLGLGLNYSTAKVDVTVAGGTPTEGKSSQTNTDLGLGYIFSSGLYLGVAMDSMSGESGGDKPKSSAMGLSLGYMGRGFLFHAHYFLSGSYDANDTTKWSSGSGIGVNLGYLFNVAGNFHLGGGIAYRSLEFKKLKANDVDVDDSSAKVTTTEPRLLFAFVF
ncbi:MAG: hypothetical protein KF802_00405 [Bdellovibrionaceae bacterium]|nr:hypothetical protein [Pseudobdellovibrionaceae bacterium]MBX3034725.1 hypothetical protein [Pseudobdellovibrionaceae bacterium]